MDQNLKAQVEYCLKEFPETRNSDIELTLRIWRQFYPQRIIIGKTGAEHIRLDSLYDLPREDNVKRIRADFNHNGQYFPTDPKVAKQRGINEERWRIALGYPTHRETIVPTKHESYTEVRIPDQAKLL